MTTLYLDMDGVLADFNKQAQTVLGASNQDTHAAAQRGRWPEEQWRKLKADPHFYRTLPKTEIADELVNVARTLRDEFGWQLFILTAIPKANDMPDAFHDKILWVQDYFPDLRVHFGPYSNDKFRHAKPGDVLIDDRKDNCTQWEAAQGLAIKVDDTNRTKAVDTLKQILEKKRSLKRLNELN